LSKSHNNKGGSIASNGYKLIYVGKEHHLSDVRGYAYEHRVVAEIKYGRRLLPTEEVHHKDHDKLNNSPENLEISDSKKHHRFLHRVKESDLRLPDEENVLIKCKCGCGSEFMRYDYSGRPRLYISGHNPSDNSGEKFILEQIKLGNNTTKGILYKYGKNTIKTILSRMVKDGIISRISLGIYKLKTNEG